MRLPCLSPEFETRRRPPGVSTTAFTTHLPDLQPWPLMDMDFGISSPLVRPVLPHIRFLFVRSRLCSTLPSDPASRRRPCAQLHPSPSSGWVEDLHLRAVVHARHTAKGGMRFAFPPYGLQKPLWPEISLPRLHGPKEPRYMEPQKPC